MKPHLIVILAAVVLSGCNLFEATTVADVDGGTETSADVGVDAADVSAPVPDMSTPDMSTADVPCVPASDIDLCADLGFDCDQHELVDNCGEQRTIVCGACDTDALCTQGVCVCQPESDESVCARMTATCGTLTTPDNCGVSRTVDCGECTLPATCGGGGTANVCACPAETDVEFCAANGATCGVLTAMDSCGLERTVECGTCTAPETCGGGSDANTCGCAAESDGVFCSRLGAACGAISAADNCGLTRNTNCGGCDVDEMCSTNVCVCAPESDADFCARVLACGPVSDFDNCGTVRSVDCPAACPAGEQCQNDKCTCAPESALSFCTSNARECGSYTGADNCGAQRTEDCGSCPGTEVCSTGVCVPAFPPADVSTWLRADEGIVPTMQGEVDVWTDRLNAVDWAAPSIPARPTFIASAQAGFPAVRWFGGQALVTQTALSSPEFTAVLVIQRMDTNREGPLLGTWGAAAAQQNEFAYGTTDTTIRMDSASAGLSFSATVLPTSDLMVVTLRAGGGTFEFFQGDTVTASAPYTGSSFLIDTLGAFQSIRFFRGDLYELMMWPRALSDAERAVVTSTLEQRYGL